mgnify:CR=1 FL=1
MNLDVIEGLSEDDISKLYLEIIDNPQKQILADTQCFCYRSTICPGKANYYNECCMAQDIDYNQCSTRCQTLCGTRLSYFYYWHWDCTTWGYCL